MGKGYIKLYRSEADIPKLWENTALFAAYQKLKIVALWPEGVISKPTRVLAKQLAMSINTLRKAVDGLEELGLVEMDISATNSWRLKIKYVEHDFEIPLNAPQISPKPAAGVNLLNKPEQAVNGVLDPLRQDLTTAAPGDLPEPDSDSNFDTGRENGKTATQNLIHSVSKNDTLAYQKMNHVPYIESLYRNNIYKTPHYPPVPQGFVDFWNAYPNKKGKQPALKKWLRGNFDWAVIQKTLEQQKRLRDWVKCDGKYIPHATTYLNQKRWEDVLPTGEQYYILDVLQPKTEREVALRYWLDATNPELLEENDLQKINNVLETDRAAFEDIITRCGGNIQKAFKVMKHGWQSGCSSIRAIFNRTASYLTDFENN